MSRFTMHREYTKCTESTNQKVHVEVCSETYYSWLTEDSGIAGPWFDTLDEATADAPLDAVLFEQKFSQAVHGRKGK